MISEFNRKDRLRDLGHIQSKENRLIVFIGGGGVGSEWYKDAIRSTHTEFGHYSIKVPPYELQEVPYPSDFELNGVPRQLFHRFAIAYGLSVPFGEGPDFTLPSTSTIKPPEPQQSAVPNYLDSKDIYD